MPRELDGRGRAKTESRCGRLLYIHHENIHGLLHLTFGASTPPATSCQWKIGINAGRVWRGYAAKSGGACSDDAPFPRHFYRRVHRPVGYVPI